jgi:hypothetical protein
MQFEKPLLSIFGRCVDGLAQKKKREFVTYHENKKKDT